MAVRHLVLVACAVLSGCATTGGVTRVPLPVACRVAIPERPVMPTEQFKSKPDLDQWVQAALAEIERREGYEGELVAALRACTKPLE
jgi:hypothetical protein